MIFKSLISRVILLNILLLTTGIGIFTFFHIQRDQNFHISAAKDSAELLLATIENSVFNAMCLGDSHKLQLTLEKIGRSNSIANVRIFHPDGIILNSANPDEVGESVSPFDLEVYKKSSRGEVFRVGGDEVLGVVKPIETDERCFMCHGVGRRVIGVLNLNYSLSDTTRKLQGSSKFFLFSTVLIIVILSVGVSFTLLRFVKRPLQDMAEKMALVKRGDLSVRLVPTCNDEVGSLMQSFNAMVVNLEKAQEELQACHYRQMERADRLASVGEMATGLAHEIRNPLAAISGAVSVLADGFEEQDPRKEVVGKVVEQIVRLDKTVTDLLHFGRPGKPEFTFVDINSLVQKTLFFINQHPESRNIQRAQDLATGLPPVWVDEKQIQQIFFNIIINAVQEMKDGGTLTIKTDSIEREGRETVRVHISDTGRGIGPEQLENIFTPFFTTKTQGTGLGLAICRQLIESHGGVIDVESREGEGTTFIVELPVTVMHPEYWKEDQREES